MKFRIEKETRVLRRNILGTPIEVEERNFIYFKRGLRKYYVQFSPDNYPITLSIIQKVEVSFTKDKKKVHWLKSDEADFVLKDIYTNPDKYIIDEEK